MQASFILRLGQSLQIPKIVEMERVNKKKNPAVAKDIFFVVRLGHNVMTIDKTSEVTSWEKLMSIHILVFSWNAAGIISMSYDLILLKKNKCQ